MISREESSTVQDVRQAILEAANAVAVEAEADVYLFNSAIARPIDDLVISSCCSRTRRRNAVVVLVTEGGDADSAYRIARCFQDHYKKFTCVVAGYCKSAGTLILAGAHELVMNDFGELGPLDVQMTKKDELGERESGLLVTSALLALRHNAFRSFEHFFLTMQRKSRFIITFRTAAEYATKLTIGLFAPIYGQIDPRQIAESSRAQAIGREYGTRLAIGGQNIDEDGVERLISQYPTHGFVIDRAEAEGLFKVVRKPTPNEAHLIKCLGVLATEPQDEIEMVHEFLSGEVNENGGEDVGSEKNAGAGDDAPARASREGFGRENGDAGKVATEPAAPSSID